MAALEIIALDEVTPQLRAPGAGGTLVSNQTWNNSGTLFTGFALSINDTASNANSLFMDCKVGATSRAVVHKNGGIFSAVGIQVGPIAGSTKTVDIGYTTTAIGMSSAFRIAWSSGNSGSSGLDTTIVRSAAQTIRITGVLGTESGNLDGADLSMPNLPTSDPVAAGQLWNNAGVLSVSAG